VEGTPKELADIKSVTYILHPTFPNPVRVMTNRAQKFRLDSSGWGEFTIKLQIRRKHGELVRRSHVLRFESPPSESDRPPRKGPIVFLSSSATDSSAGTAIRKALEARNVIVVSSSDIKSNLPWQAYIETSLRSADATIAIISDATSPWVSRELEMARTLDVPILPVLVGKGAQMPTMIHDTQAVRLDNLNDAISAADQLTGRLGAILTRTKRRAGAADLRAKKWIEWKPSPESP